MKTPKFLTSVTNFLSRNIQRNGHPLTKKSCLTALAILLAAILVIGGILALLALLLQGLWSWIIPDIFPAAVRKGTLAREISWWTAFKLLILLSVLGSLVKGANFTSNNVKETASSQKNQPEVEAGPGNLPPESRNTPVFPLLSDPLTDRELEVLQHVAKGLTNQQIAVQIKVSESTVVYHIGHIFGKLRVNSRVEAAVWAKEHGII